MSSVKFRPCYKIQVREFESALEANVNGVPDTDSGSDPTTKK